MNYIFFDDQNRDSLFPFTLTRPVSEIRCGIMPMRIRWEFLLGIPGSSTLTISPLSAQYPIKIEEENIFINGAVAGNKNMVTAINKLIPGQFLESQKGTVIAFKLNHFSTSDRNEILRQTKGMTPIIFEEEAHELKNVWDIFLNNGALIEEDFKILTHGRKSLEIPKGVQAIAPENIFFEYNAKIEPCFLDASEGPIYVASSSQIMQGAMIKGPFSMAEHSVVKMGAKIYGGTSLGENCKVGGELNNAVFFNHSNKAHDGFIGNAVIGNWCNLGADTNCSNLKNNYDFVKVWDHQKKEMSQTGLQFCGLIMGDHSKSGINTMFNTGTMVGVSCNIFGSGFPDKYIPSFTWGGMEEKQVYRFEKAIETAERMMARRNLVLSEAELTILKNIFNHREGE